jgi:hypothetical protein
MRREIAAHVASSGAGLEPLARAALETLKQNETSKNEH